MKKIRKKEIKNNGLLPEDDQQGRNEEINKKII